MLAFGFLVVSIALFSWAIHVGNKREKVTAWALQREILVNSLIDNPDVHRATRMIERVSAETPLAAPDPPSLRPEARLAIQLGVRFVDGPEDVVLHPRPRPLSSYPPPPHRPLSSYPPPGY